MTEISKLPELAKTANQFHASAQKAFGQGLNFARSAGNVLLEAKSLVAHGQWESWVETNCSFSTRTARGYLQIASNWIQIDAKRAELPELSLRGALELISTPKLEDDSKRQRVAVLRERPAKNQERPATGKVTDEATDQGDEEDVDDDEPVTIHHFSLADEQGNEHRSQQPIDSSLPTGWMMTGWLDPENSSDFIVVESVTEHLEFLRIAVYRRREVRLTPRHFEMKYLPKLLQSMMADIDYKRIQWHPPKRRLAAYNPLAVVRAITEWKYPPSERIGDDEE
ncbi:MAG: DUF3102 domain-containing protein [Schlesneria sp.]